MVLEDERVKRWLVHFGLLHSEDDWEHTHVSGHGSGDQIKQVIEHSNAKMVVPIHTEHEDYHKKWHQNVRMTDIGNSIML